MAEESVLSNLGMAVANVMCGVAVEVWMIVGWPSNNSLLHKERVASS